MNKSKILPRLIAVEGAIGAGKTSLARLLSENSSARLVLEKDNDNPFLLKFYENQETMAFQTQIFFLLGRYNQYMQLAQMDLFSSNVVIDYLFPRDRIFAELTLKESEQRLYNQIFNLLNTKISKPDLVIFLQASSEVLLKRVKKRARSYEQNLNFDYLDAVNRAFNNFFFYYSETPLLVINTNEIDFVKKKYDLEQLIQKINSHKIGREYYNPLGS